MIKWLLEYLISPGLTCGLSLLAGLDWTSRASDKINMSVLLMSPMLLIVAAYAYETGYKGFWKAGRKRYFYIVFILPIVVSMLCMVAGLVFRQQ